MLRKICLCIFVSTAFLASTMLFAATPKLRDAVGSPYLETLQNSNRVAVLNLNESMPELLLSQEQIARIKRNLLDDHNYKFDSRKIGRFQPKLSVKFAGDEGRNVIMFVSPETNQLMMSAGERTVLLSYEPARIRINAYFSDLIDEIERNNS